MDPEQDRFPHSIVFAPIPILTWLCPLIGHVGICDSLGRVHDFSESHHVSIDRMAFGRPAFYSLLSKVSSEKYDDAIFKADQYFRGQQHLWLSSNCHHHVAMCLSQMAYNDHADYTATQVWVMFWKNVQVAPERSLFIGFIFPCLLTYMVVFLFVYWTFY